MMASTMASPSEMPLIFERGAPGRRAFRLPECDVPEKPLDDLLPEQHRRRKAPLLPECGELEVVRHYTNLSRRNFGIDVGFYPLGSCTMKYNPKVNDWAAALPGFQRIHPYQPDRKSTRLNPVTWPSRMPSSA